MKKLLVVSLLVVVLIFGTTTQVFGASVNLALTAEAVATSEWVQFPAPFAIDGKADTFWSCFGEATPTLTITLAEKATVSQLVITNKPEGTDPAADQINILNILFDGVVVKTVEDYPMTRDEKVIIDIEAKEVTVIDLEVEEGTVAGGFTEVEIYSAAAPNPTEKPADPTAAPTAKPGNDSPKTADIPTMVSFVAVATSGLGALIISKKRKNR